MILEYKKKKRITLLSKYSEKLGRVTSNMFLKAMLPVGGLSQLSLSLTLIFTYNILMNRPKPSISQKAWVDFLYLDSVFDKRMIK